MQFNKNRNLSIHLIFWVSITILSFAIGYRNIDIGTDTATYTYAYLAQMSCKCIPGRLEVGYEVFSLPISLLSFTPETFFSIVALLIFILLNISIITTLKILNKGVPVDIRQSITVFSLLISTPLIIQLQINAIRQGISTLILLLSFLYLQSNNKYKSFILLITALSFHYSTLLILPFYIVLLYSHIKESYKYMASIYTLTILSFLYILSLSEDIVKFVSIKMDVPIWSTVKEYGEASITVYKSGVRYDFFFFTLLLILPLLLVSIKHNYLRKYFIFIVICFIPFLLLGWGNYSNRYLLAIWTYAPLVFLAYVSIKLKHLKHFYLLFLVAAILINLIYVT